MYKGGIFLEKLASRLDTQSSPTTGVIDQVWVQDGWILVKFFFCVFMFQDEVKVHKLAKTEQGQYPAILTGQAWSTKGLLDGYWGNFSCRTWWVVPSGQDTCSSILLAQGSQSQCRIWFILPARGASHIIKYNNEWSRKSKCSAQYFYYFILWKQELPWVQHQ